MKRSLTSLILERSTCQPKVKSSTTLAEGNISTLGDNVEIKKMGNSLSQLSVSCVHVTCEQSREEVNTKRKFELLLMMKSLKEENGIRNDVIFRH